MPKKKTAVITGIAGIADGTKVISGGKLCNLADEDEDVYDKAFAQVWNGTLTAHKDPRWEKFFVRIFPRMGVTRSLMFSDKDGSIKAYTDQKWIPKTWKYTDDAGTSTDIVDMEQVGWKLDSTKRKYEKVGGFPAHWKTTTAFYFAGSKYTVINRDRQGGEWFLAQCEGDIPVVPVAAPKDDADKKKKHAIFGFYAGQYRFLLQICLDSYDKYKCPWPKDGAKPFLNAVFGYYEFLKDFYENE